MASIKKESVGRKDLFLLDPEKIHEKEGWNVREETDELSEHIEQLALSIAEVGVQQPITVYMENNTIYLSDGHCRLAGVKLAISRGAEIKSIPCRVEERYSNDADRVLAMIVRNSGKPLTPLEKASVVKRLVAFGWSESEIAKKTGISKQYVGRLLQMEAMPEALKGMVKDGTVSASVAVETFRDQGAEKAVESITEAAGKQQGEKKKKRVTKKSLSDKKPKVKPEFKAIEVLKRHVKTYSAENAEKITDLLADLELLLIEATEI